MARSEGSSARNKLFGRLNGLRFRLVLFALIAAIPFVWYRTADIRSDETAIVDEIRAEAIATASRGAQELGDVFNEARTLLSTLAKVPVVAAGSPEDCATFLQSVRNLADWAKNIIVANSKGTLVCGTDPKVRGIELADRAYFQDAVRSHGFVVSDFIHSRLDGRPILVAAFPIFGLNNVLEAVVAGTLNLSWFDSIAAEVGEKTGGTVLLVDKAGMVLARYPKTEPVTGGAQMDLRPGSAIGGGATGTYESRDGDDERRLYGVARLPGTNAMIAVGLSIESSLADTSRRFRSAYVTAALIGFMIILLAWLFGEIHFVGPLRDLMSATARLREGDLGARVEIRYPSREFREVAASFNTMADRLAALATIDGLTGVANRRRFDQYMIDEWRRALRSKQPLALALIDIDQFKFYNDRNGHLAGDECLRRVATELGRFARRTEDLLGRYGGEEFVLGLPGLTESEALQHCERLRKAIEHTMGAAGGGTGARVTVSVGLAVCIPDASNTPDTLVAMADTALYNAKRAGRNRTAIYGGEREQPNVNVA